jgi:hypothetical protein
MRATGTFCGVLDAPTAETVMDATRLLGRYPLIPIGRAVRSIDTVAVEGAVPVLGPILSQLWLLVAVQASVPLPVLVIFSAWLAGCTGRKHT